jgi:hypothetical protein
MQAKNTQDGDSVGIYCCGRDARALGRVRSRHGADPGRVSEERLDGVSRRLTWESRGETVARAVGEMSSSVGGRGFT